jgi:hypothetical protein
MSNLLQQCANNFGFAPRDFSLLDRLTYLRVPRPVWAILRPFHKIQRHFWSLGRLWHNGIVVWGCVVQATEWIGTDINDEDSPGDVLFVLDGALQVDPQYVQQVANSVFSLKRTRPRDEDEAILSRHFRDGRMQLYGFEIPNRFCPTMRCYLTSTYFTRKHLPERRLSKTTLPIVVEPHPPYHATPLPKRYWPQELVEWWKS